MNVKRVLVAILATANLITLAMILSHQNPTLAQKLTVADLSYGWTDVDGDGEYSPADDYVLEWFLENSPEHIDEALRTARVNEDGGIDLSSYLEEAGKLAHAR